MLENNIDLNPQPETSNSGPQAPLGQSAQMNPVNVPHPISQEWLSTVESEISSWQDHAPLAQVLKAVVSRLHALAIRIEKDGLLQARFEVVQIAEKRLLDMIDRLDKPNSHWGSLGSMEVGKPYLLKPLQKDAALKYAWRKQIGALEAILDAVYSSIEHRAPAEFSEELALVSQEVELVH